MKPRVRRLFAVMTIASVTLQAERQSPLWAEPCLYHLLPSSSTGPDRMVVGHCAVWVRIQIIVTLTCLFDGWSHVVLRLKQCARLHSRVRGKPLTTTKEHK